MGIADFPDVLFNRLTASINLQVSLATVSADELEQRIANRHCKELTLNEFGLAFAEGIC
jgi:hypothetical protein